MPCLLEKTKILNWLLAAFCRPEEAHQQLTAQESEVEAVQWMPLEVCKCLPHALQKLMGNLSSR